MALQCSGGGVGGDSAGGARLASPSQLDEDFDPCSSGM